MSNVEALPFVSRQAALGEPNPELVALLENLLGRARAGTLQQVVVAGLHDDGSPITAHSLAQPHDAFALHGAIALQLHRSAQRLLEAM